MDSHAARSAADSPPRRGRPKRDPATSEVRRRLIRTGLAHLTERGYSAVGLDEILKAASVPKGGFYHYFSNKAEFGAALIDAYNAYFCELLDRALLDERMTPLDRLRAFAAEAERGMARHGFRRGCLVGNLGQEMGALPEEFRDRLVSVLEEWQRRTERCLQLAQQAGEIGPAQDPEALAAFFWIGWEGAVLRAKLERRAEPLQRFADSYFTSITP